MRIIFFRQKIPQPINYERSLGKFPHQICLTFNLLMKQKKNAAKQIRGKTNI